MDSFSYAKQRATHTHTHCVKEVGCRQEGESRYLRRGGGVSRDHGLQMDSFLLHTLFKKLSSMLGLRFLLHGIGGAKTQGTDIRMMRWILGSPSTPTQSLAMTGSVHGSRDEGDYQPQKRAVMCSTKEWCFVLLSH